MSEFIVLSGCDELMPEGTKPMQEFLTWRDQLVAERGDKFYEDYMNGIVNEDGTLTEEAIRAQEEFDAWYDDRYSN